MVQKTIALCVLCYAGFSPAHAFPRDFSGHWEDKRTKDSGVLTIAISAQDAESLRGVISIDGSPYCTSPVSFRGTLHGTTASIESDALIVCGHNGKLIGEVRRVDDTLYVGSFQYELWGITWAKGTFRLAPATQGYK